MNTYHNGQGVRIPATFKNTSGTLTDPSSVALTILKPDGSTDTLSPTHDSTGVYHADYTSTSLPGAYTWRWMGTGAVVAPLEGTFYVLPAYA